MRPKDLSYLDGRLDYRDKYNPFEYREGLFDGGVDGSDFTVGAVDRYPVRWAISTTACSADWPCSECADRGGDP